MRLSLRGGKTGMGQHDRSLCVLSPGKSLISEYTLCNHVGVPKRQIIANMHAGEQATSQKKRKTFLISYVPHWTDLYPEMC